MTTDGVRMEEGSGACGADAAAAAVAALQRRAAHARAHTQHKGSEGTNKQHEERRIAAGSISVHTEGDRRPIKSIRVHWLKG